MRPELVLAVVFALVPRAVPAAVTVFAKDLAGFNAAAGNPPIVVDFDSVPFGTDIGGTTIAGLTFTPSASGGAPLIVVEAADTMTPAAGFTGIVDANTNVLTATTGAGVISPGGGVLGPGPDEPVENDDLVVNFAVPASAVGFDHLSQSADGASSSSITVYSGNTFLYGGTIVISNLGPGGAPAGADFWGIVSDAADITRIEINEGDSNSSFPDCNVGYDTFRVASVGGVTTTTSGSGTSTTATGSSVTTTTIPSACGSTVTFAQLNCRLMALRIRVAGADVGKLASKLRGQLLAATAKKEQAEDKCASGDTKRARKGLKKSERKIIGFSHRVRSLNGRRAIPDAALRDELTGTADGIKDDMKTLRGRLDCA